MSIFKYKKCDKCIYYYGTALCYCCSRPDKYGLRPLRRRKHICFKFKQREGN